MKKIILLLLPTLFVLSLSFNLLLTSTALADVTSSATEQTGPPPDASNYTLQNPLGAGSPTIQVVIQNVIKALLGLIGVIALVMFIIGGFKVMTAAGDAKKVRSGLDTLLWAALGLVLIFASRLLLNTVLGAF